MGIRTIFRAIFDAVLPLKERRQCTETRSVSDIPLFLDTHELLGTHILTMLDYRQTEVAELIQSLKYDHSLHAAKLCAALLEDYLREELSYARMFSSKSVFLIPVPLHKDRVRERGFNQVEKILRLLPSEFQNGSLSSILPLLVRVCATKQQTHLSREERLQNVAGAFEVLNTSILENAHVFLIDDVVTTGATLVEASKPLVRSKASVTLLALARA